MQSENPLHINLARLGNQPYRFEIELTDRFFADLEQEEISGGDVHAQILVKAMTDCIYQIQAQMQGRVVTLCDRCLEPLTLTVQAETELKVKDAPPHESDDPEMQYLEADNPCYDLSWDLYEAIETAMPIQRVHPEDECNPEMTRYILKDAPEAE
ncbi:MAG: YceD family protein [Bacteroidales bacterium]|uniref:YceD family protein n=1 Tax=Sodaliphilus pleomorphus TaxID=2606626 RepID=UPI00240A60B0|nr:YceD family protein [Sodaliphilus pleomorphus]MCI7050502.1 DUF177 domain-containing protein [Bacteroidales bacterium]MDD6687082.1 YceD family protein [Sodaliphilus pleomorphus]MDD6732016.1 YceD family protein [Bacteroidales bacterium]